MTDSDAGERSPWEVIDESVVHTTPEFDVVEQHIRTSDGTETTLTHLHEPPAVVVLPFTENGDVVVIDEWRPAVGRRSRSVPAGSIDPDEPIATAARRELREETGYDPGHIVEVASVEPANGVSNTVHHHVLAHDCTPSADQDLDVDEAISVETTDLETLRTAARRGTLRDGRTMLAVLLHAFRNP